MSSGRKSLKSVELRGFKPRALTKAIFHNVHICSKKDI